MKRYNGPKIDTNLKLGQHRGNPRFWLEGKALAALGFTPGTLYTADFKVGSVLLSVSFEGERMVAKRELNGALLPIIDINSPLLASSLGKCERVSVKGRANNILITPAK